MLRFTNLCTTCDPNDCDLCSKAKATAKAMDNLRYLKHLPNVKTRFYCPQAFLSLDFQCKDDVSEFTIDVSGLKRAPQSNSAL
jgi:hypothetical protein